MSTTSIKCVSFLMLATTTLGCALSAADDDPAAGADDALFAGDEQESVAEASQAVAEPEPPPGWTAADVSVRAGDSGSYLVNVLARTRRCLLRPCTGARVLAVHGLAHNARFFVPLGNELIDAASGVDAFVSISLPGHGGSEIPDGKVFGEVTLEDYADAVVQVARGLGRFDVVVGHSMGGMVVQLAEKQLQAAGTSFNERHGTQRITLLASTTPQGVLWTEADSGALQGLLVTLNAVQTTPARGTFVTVDNPTWHGLFYQQPSFSGVPVAGAPALATAPLLRADEPGAAAFALLGQPGLPRPSIPKHLFKGYELVNVAFSEDSLVSRASTLALGSALSPAPINALLSSRDGKKAIHTAPYTMPEHVAPAVRLD